ncbi:hypothetical protein KUTeg_020051 [Tegillarca granosa]|uniref:Serine-threonine/tyrosine-protein kinase catalytic domain-containing protein n=1 Tax=Tegillarca granosa TaxID=220873 RepID=A0ABQ9E9F9_TEGGR|nr:hypothetical protein KUTeg_020051 [Tegillarca granosa]
MGFRFVEALNIAGSSRFKMLKYTVCIKHNFYLFIYILYYFCYTLYNVFILYLKNNNISCIEGSFKTLGLRTNKAGNRNYKNILAIVLCKNWYCTCAEDDVKLQIDFPGDFQSFTLHNKNVKPLEDWIKLIKQCWEYETDRRPEIITIITFFEDFIRSSK